MMVSDLLGDDASAEAEAGGGTFTGRDGVAVDAGTFEGCEGGGVARVVERPSEGSECAELVGGPGVGVYELDSDGLFVVPGDREGEALTVWGDVHADADPGGRVAGAWRTGGGPRAGGEGGRCGVGGDVGERASPPGYVVSERFSCRVERSGGCGVTDCRVTQRDKLEVFRVLTVAEAIVDEAGSRRGVFEGGAGGVVLSGEPEDRSSPWVETIHS
ncbi:MAG: hypothetical protein LCH60_06965 [Actinobacteria bacterium]|nr:hypothetical protein [Actinomycetota bacterium]